MLVLGIETSCDETGLALVEDGARSVAVHLASSLRAHQRYGGVVPEIASRAHVEWMTEGLEGLFQKAGLAPSAVDRIAVTTGPGLAGSLLVGISAAKALAAVWRREVVGVNHLQAHLYAAWMETPPWLLEAPAVGLVVSGGHTALVRLQGISKPVLLGQTRDDAMGEAFDKVASMLGLGFPGGPEIERVAGSGDPAAFRFSAPRMKSGAEFDFSFSGIKTAVLYQVREQTRSLEVGGGRGKGPSLPPPSCPLPPVFVADLAASFQQAVVEEVVEKALRACRRFGIHRLVVGGGVIANQLLRRRLREAAEPQGVQLAIPPMRLCMDNGEMIAGLGFHLRPQAGDVIQAVPGLSVEANGTSRGAA